MKSCLGLAIILGLVGCADDLRPAPPTNPRAAYSAARIAEGAYLASGHVDPLVLAKLAALDRRARTALEQWQQLPDATNAAQANIAVADLADCLVHEARF